MTNNDAYAGQVKVVGKHGGTKLDGAKPQYSLVPPDSLKAVAEVMTEGAKKYSANNWVGLELSRVLDALERHIHDFKMGEDFASDSQQHHMAHAIANAMMAYHIATKRPSQDDRLFKSILGKSETEKFEAFAGEKTGPHKDDVKQYESDKYDSSEKEFSVACDPNFLEFYKDIPWIEDAQPQDKDVEEHYVDRPKPTYDHYSNAFNAMPDGVQYTLTGIDGNKYSYTGNNGEQYTFIDTTSQLDKGHKVTLPARAKRRQDALKKIFAEGSTPARREALERVAQAFAHAEGANIGSRLTKDDLTLKRNGYWRVL